MTKTNNFLLFIFGPSRNQISISSITLKNRIHSISETTFTQFSSLNITVFYNTVQYSPRSIWNQCSYKLPCTHYLRLPLVPMPRRILLRMHTRIYSLAQAGRMVKVLRVKPGSGGISFRLPSFLREQVEQDEGRGVERRLYEAMVVKETLCSQCKCS